MSLFEFLIVLINTYATVEGYAGGAKNDRVVPSIFKCVQALCDNEQ